MIATATHYISSFNTNYVEPSIDWMKNHKIAVSVIVSLIGISVLLGVGCYNSPQTLDMMKKNIKFLTVVVPIAYTIPSPIIGFVLAMSDGTDGRHRSHGASMRFEAYCNSIVKVWQVWFAFVGISA